MKKIKTIFAILMILTMTLGLAACGSAGSNEASSTQTSEAQNTSEENVKGKRFSGNVPEEDLQSWID